jgi:hypothetical protein
MREFFIQIKDGQPFEHPLGRTNVQHLFPQHDLDVTVPDNFAVFHRIPRPLHTSPYQKSIGPVYTFNEAGEVYDKWELLEMTPGEKDEKQNAVKGNWGGPASWIFDEETCQMKPSKPYPGNIDGTPPYYKWNEEIQDWEVVEPQVPPVINT